MLKKLIPWLWLTLGLFSIIALARPGYFEMHDDIQAIRTHQMALCLRDLQIPCHWVPDMGMGYGYPQFIFYPPLPYVIMALGHLAGLEILDSVKAFGFILPTILSLLGMYFLAKQFWGEKGAVIAALFYTYLPYRLLNTYVRGAMGELWGMVWMPWIFWAIERYLRTRNHKYLIWLSLLGTFMATSHLLSALMLGIFLIPWLIYRLWGQSDWLRQILWLCFSGIIALGLSAFFIFPAMLEQPHVHIETITMGYFQYYNHFVSISQLFTNTHWGFGSSEVGIYDGMSFQVGIWHWLIVVVSIAIGSAIVIRKKQLNRSYLNLIFIALAALSYLILTHSRTTPVWKIAEPLQILQFPWRFLAPAGFFISLAAGSVALWNKQLQWRHLWIVILPLLFFNYAYTKPKAWLPYNDSIKMQGELWTEQQMMSVFDYLPKSVDVPPTQLAPDSGYPLTGQASLVNYQIGSDWQSATIVAQSPATIQIPMFDYPGMQVTLDDQPIPHTSTTDNGLITFDVQPGDYLFKTQLNNTRLRTSANIITLISLVGLITWITILRRSVSSSRTKSV